MKKLFLAAAALLSLSTAAEASLIPVLDSITPIGPDFEFSYSATLAGDTGLVPGSTLVIFDFAGYVAGSISASIYAADVLAFTELTSTLTPQPGVDDDPTVENLVFRWIGAPFNSAGGPFPDVDLAGLSARSTFSATTLDGYAGLTTTNNGGATGQLAFNTGLVSVPEGGGGSTEVPEPASWALMIFGFGMAGSVLRRRRVGRSVRHLGCPSY